jgi:hypothetical protein
MPRPLTIQPNFAKLAGAVVKTLQCWDRKGRLEIAMTALELISTIPCSRVIRYSSPPHLRNGASVSKPVLDTVAYPRCGCTMELAKIW